jgi:hypothetical protein
MNTPTTPNFLRRTAVAFAAAAVLAISLPVSAQNNLIKKSTGEAICNYSGLRITPTGGVEVTCDPSTPTTPTTPTPGTFTVSGPAEIPFGAAATVTITRSGGTSGASTVSYEVGGGCGPLNGSVNFGDGFSSGTFTLRSPGGPTNCTVTLLSPTVGTLGSPSTLKVAVNGTAAQPTTPTQAGCAAPPNDVLDFNLLLSGADRLIMSSGRIASAVLPKVSDTRNSFSGQILFGESTISPRAATVEISVSKCKGVIDTAGGSCYLSSSNPSFLKMEWIEKPIWDASTDTIAANYNLCKAYMADGTFFVNVRYSYSASDCQYGQCGFVDQWNYAAF